MEVCSVAFPPEYNELFDMIMALSNESRQSISKTIRDILCDYTGFEPVLTREIKRQNRPRKA
jgi:hypothetical protein